MYISTKRHSCIQKMDLCYYTCTVYTPRFPNTWSVSSFPTGPFCWADWVAASLSDSSSDWSSCDEGMSRQHHWQSVGVQTPSIGVSEWEYINSTSTRTHAHTHTHTPRRTCISANTTSHQLCKWPGVYMCEPHIMHRWHWFTCTCTCTCIYISRQVHWQAEDLKLLHAHVADKRFARGSEDSAGHI